MVYAEMGRNGLMAVGPEVAALGHEERFPPPSLSV